MTKAQIDYRKRRERGICKDCNYASIPGRPRCGPCHLRNKIRTRNKYRSDRGLPADPRGFQRYTRLVRGLGTDE